MLDIRSFRENDCVTYHSLVFVKVRKRMTVIKQATQKFNEERFNLRKLNELEPRKQYHIKGTNIFAALEHLNDGEDINRAWKNIKGNIKTAAKECLVSHELKPHKPWFD